MELDWKFASASEFAKLQSSIAAIISSNQHCSQILRATSGCISTGSDSDNVALLCCDGFPNRALDFIQEMGR